MSKATKNSTAKNSTAKNSTKKPAAKKLVFSRLFSEAQKNGETSFAVGDGVSRHGIGSHDRSPDGAEQSSKARLTAYAVAELKAGRTVNVKTLAAYVAKHKLLSQKTGQLIKLSTIRSWLGNWKRGIAGGAFYNAIANDIGIKNVESAFAKLRKNS